MHHVAAVEQELVRQNFVRSDMMRLSMTECLTSFKSFQEVCIYYMLQSSGQILRSALLDDGTSHAGDFKSDSVFMRGSIISKRPHDVFECILVIYALKHNNCMIRLYL